MNPNDVYIFSYETLLNFLKDNPNGDLEIHHIGLGHAGRITTLPDMSRVIIAEYFGVNNNLLSDLVGMPKRVDGSIACTHNN